MERKSFKWGSSLMVVSFCALVLLFASLLNTKSVSATEPEQVDPATAEAVINDTTYYSTLKAAIAASSDGDTIKVLQNVTFTSEDDGKIGHSITLDLNGQTITATTTNNNVFYINVTGKTVTVIDTSVNSNGVIDGGGKNRAFCCKGSFLTINAGTIRNCGRTNASGGSIYVDTNGTLTLNGGTITGGIVYQAYKESSETNYYGGNIYVYSGTFTMTGGEISGGDCWNHGGNVYLGAGVTMTMSGGTISDGRAGCVAGDDAANAGHAVVGKGGNIYIHSTTNKPGQLIMTGGVVTGGRAKNETGGNIWVDGIADISGDSIVSYGVATGAGNIFVNIGSSAYEKSILRLHGNAIVLNGRTCSATDTFDTGANQNIFGNGSSASNKKYVPSQIFIYENAKVTFDENCDWTTSGNSGNVGTQGQLTVKDNAEISNGRTSGTGGNIRFYAWPAVSGYQNFVHIEGGLITNGEAKTGGNLYAGNCAQNEVVISGGTISNGWAKNDNLEKGGNCYFATITVWMTGGLITNGATGSKKNSGQVAANVQLYSDSGNYYFLGGRVMSRFDLTKKYGNLVFGGSIQVNFSATNGLYRTNSSGYVQNITIWPMNDDADLHIQLFTQDSAAITDKTLFATLGTNSEGVAATNLDLQKIHIVPDIAATSSIILTDDDNDGRKESVRIVSGHYACVCGGVLEDGKTYGVGDTAFTHICNYVEWTEWSDTTTLPTAEDCSALGDNYFYLSKNVSMSGSYKPMTIAKDAEAKADQTLASMADYSLHLDLNGKTVTIDGVNRFITGLRYSEEISGKTTYYYAEDISISICDTHADTGAGGTVQQEKNREFSTQQGQFIFFNGANCQIDIYGGSFLANGAKVGSNNGSIYLANGSTVNFYGGYFEALSPRTNPTTFIFGGKTRSSTESQGGVVCLTSGAKMNMYGGELVGAPRNHGGAIYSSSATSEINIYGGIIRGGDVRNTTDYPVEKGCGGAIYIAYATLRMYGGLITGGKAETGGNIFLSTSASFLFEGGEISGGTSDNEGGNIYATSSTLTMNGGIISNGISSGSYGGNIVLNASSAFIMNDGTITGGRANTQGGNVIVNNSDATFVLKGGEIKNGVATNYGGNVALANSGSFDMIGGKLAAGSTIVNISEPRGGGNIGMASGVCRLFGGTIEGGKSYHESTADGVTGYGGNIYANAGTLKLYGVGTEETDLAGNSVISTGILIQNGDTKGCGGNIAISGKPNNSSTSATCKLTIYGGTIKNGTSDSYGGNIYIRSSNAATIQGGEISFGNKCNVFVEEDSTLNISGGEIHSGTGTNGYNIRANGTVNISGTADITGNELSCDNNSISAQGSNSIISISGGTFDNAIQAVHGDITISGGTFNEVESRYSDASVTITNGTFNGEVRTGNSSSAQSGSGTLSISGGVFKSNVSLTETGDITITDGWFSVVPEKTVSATGGTIAISGGYYMTEPAAQYIVDGHAAFAEQNVHEEVTYEYVIDEVLWLTLSSKATEGDLTYIAALSGGGVYRKGTSVGIAASKSVNSKYTFVGWYLNGTLFESQAEANVTMNETTDLYAMYEYGGEDVEFSVTISAEDSSFKVKVGDGEFSSLTDSYIANNVLAGTVYTVVYEGSEPFIAWQNGIRKFMTTNTTYTFTVGSNITLEAFYSESTSTKKVAFLNTNNQVLKLVSWTVGESTIEGVAPAIPDRTGKVADDWYIGATKATTAMIDASADNYIAVYAKYTVLNTTYTVHVKKATVTGQEFTGWAADENDLVTKTQILAKPANITVDDLIGEAHFVCFKASETGEVLSYNSSFIYHATEDTTIYAVYAVEEATKKPTITMTSAIVLNETGASFEITRSIPEGYTLVEQGVLLTADSMLSENTLTSAEAALVIDSTSCRKSVSSSTAADGITTLNVGRIGTATIYARGYAIYQKDGVNAIIYTKIAHGTTAGFVIE